MSINSLEVVKRKALSFLLILPVLLINGLLGSPQVKAAVPVPSGFQLILSDTGVRVYRKNYVGGQPDFVTVVDLRYATIRNFTGAVSGQSIERRTLSRFWNDAVAQNTGSRRATVAINGTFFSTDASPFTPIAFGLKADWWRMSYGYGLNEYPGLVRTFAFDSFYGSSSIQPYSTATFDGGIPDVVGGLDPSANKSASSYTGRTFVGVRDDDNNGDSETVVFFSSSFATQAGAVSVLSGFGTGSKMMLDGGGSTGLIIAGTTYIPPGRSIPHSIIICAGK